jgi:nicotinic acid mononucleotide adenylyltransferase
MLQRDEPSTDFSFCLGADTFLDLMAGKWKRSQDVIHLLRGRLFVIPRPINGKGGGDPNFDLEDRINELNYREGESNNAATLLSVPTLQPISSTMARQCHDLEMLQSLVVPDVLAYIRKHRLYAFQETEEAEIQM